MTLPLNNDNSEDYQFLKTLNEDIKLAPNEYNQWDMVFEEKETDTDLVNLTGYESLKNGICIAIMTRFEELYHNPLYSDFGCRIHELIKANKSSMVRYKLELYCEQTLKKIRRIKKINEITIMDNPEGKFFAYEILFNVTSITDDVITGSVII
ncbi:hypothetical protein [uncultured Methanobrevibacter sp.]|uniref:hypothetical protein n=1 Tax=uncultured Methanobrevibacter sp. TaxID=253161 RepID=UPI00262CD79B|nr:hypothetical protein [uncultured Methanobrevibacter sp.]